MPPFKDLRKQEVKAQGTTVGGISDEHGKLPASFKRSKVVKHIQNELQTAASFRGSLWLFLESPAHALLAETQGNGGILVGLKKKTIQSSHGLLCAGRTSAPS